MGNFTWDYKVLQPSDLPEKAQRFIEIMEIDTIGLKLMLLTANPNGKFVKGFDILEEKKPYGKWAAIAEFEAIYFFDDYTKVKTAIHELTHIYFSQAKFFKGIEYDFMAIAEKFISQHGRNALTNYAQISIFEDEWEEVVCEIIATYGRKGQFNKIKELLNQ
jgi:hypothetical protein